MNFYRPEVAPPQQNL